MPSTQILSFLITLPPAPPPPLLKKRIKPEVQDYKQTLKEKTHLSNVILQNPL